MLEYGEVTSILLNEYGVLSCNVKSLCSEAEYIHCGILNMFGVFSVPKIGDIILLGKIKTGENIVLGVVQVLTEKDTFKIKNGTGEISISGSGAVNITGGSALITPSGAVVLTGSTITANGEDLTTDLTI